MKTIVALYRGPTVASAELVAVSADPAIVALVAGKLLDVQFHPEDRVVEKVEKGRRSALREIRREAREAFRFPSAFDMLDKGAK